jgi:hypothetical protein
MQGHAVQMSGTRRRFASRDSTRGPDRGIEGPVSESLAALVAGTVAAYVGAGLTFALPFVLRGVQRVDPAARQATWGFRVVIVPGVVLLWPLLAARWFSGSVHPPRELNAHRRRAVTPRPS